MHNNFSIIPMIDSAITIINGVIITRILKHIMHFMIHQAISHGDILVILFIDILSIFEKTIVILKKWLYSESIHSLSIVALSLHQLSNTFLMIV